MAGRVPRRHREAPDDGGTELPDELRGSRWWYLVAATPLAVVVALVTGLLLIPLVVVLPPSLSGSVVVAWLVGVWAAGFLAALVLPVGLYADAELVGTAPTEWRPRRTLFWAAGIVAFLVYLLTTAGGVVLTAGPSGTLYGFVLGTGTGLVVSVFYLARRRRHLGVP